MGQKWLEQQLLDSFGAEAEREYREGDMASIRAYHDLRAADTPFSLDDTTWNDLDLDRVFRRVNVCLSTAGEQCLYHRLRTPVHDAREASRLRERIALFERDEGLRLGVQKALYALGSAGRADMCSVFQAAPADLYWCTAYIALALLPLLGLALLAAGVSSGLMVTLLSLMFNMGFHTWRISRVQAEFGRVNYAIRTLRAFRALMRLKDSRLNALIPSEAFRAYDICGSLTRAGALGQASLNDLSALLSAAFMFDLIIFERLKNRISQRHAELLVIYETLGGLDAAIAVASYRAGLKEWCEPELIFDAPAPDFRVKGLSHPLLDAPVSNDLPDARALLLTGSNASGKSTFLKSAALCAVMAQSLLTCTARSCALTPLHVYTSMALEDRLDRGESYYIVEIKSLKRILDAVERGEGVLCAVDEVLRGTNTIERIAASSELLRTLGQSGAVCLAATHDIELCRLLEDVFTLAHFEEKVEKDGVRFDYLLKSGPAVTRNAIRLLDLLGYPKALTQAAAARAERFARTGLWT